jgi:hypothetical protein
MPADRETHFRQLRHHHIDDFVTAAKRVVKRDGHAVLQAGATDRRFQRIADFALALFASLASQGLFAVTPGIRGQSFGITYC